MPASGLVNRNDGKKDPMGIILLGTLGAHSTAGPKLGATVTPIPAQIPGSSTVVTPMVLEHVLSSSNHHLIIMSPGSEMLCLGGDRNGRLSAALPLGLGSCCSFA